MEIWLITPHNINGCILQIWGLYGIISLYVNLGLGRDQSDIIEDSFVHTALLSAGIFSGVFI